MTKMKSLIFGVIIMESKTKKAPLKMPAQKLVNTDQVSPVIEVDEEEIQVEFSLENWEPQGLVIEFEPDEELQDELDLDDDEVIEIELEPLPN